ncbi:histone-lysine N-methyltransferase set-1-like isoform 2-T4 [Menidia menidia]
MEKGSLERLEGNSLEELELEDKLEPDAEQNSSGNAEEEKEDEPLDGPLTPVQDALEHIKAQRDKGFRQEKFIDSFKGRGVFTNESVEPPSFVVEYRGEISRHEDPQRKRDTLNGFVFDFSLSRTNWSVDASAEDGSLGRLVNDDHLNPNYI